jgi:tellurite resistance protein TehA-like permease
MNKRTFDAVLCNWPLLGIPVIVVAKIANEFQAHPIAQVLIGAVFGGGWLVSLIYGFFRLAQQKFETKKTIFWVLGLLWFSVISLPWLYWKYLRRNQAAD